MLFKSTTPSQKVVRITAVDVGGFGGAAPAARPAVRIRRNRKERAARKYPRIWFWHDLFGHINDRWHGLNGRNYPWANADRKILANMSRKFGVPAVMAMWDLYFEDPAPWFKSTGGRVYGMARDGDRLRDLPGFKKRARLHLDRLNQSHGHMDIETALKLLGL